MQVRSLPIAPCSLVAAFALFACAPSSPAAPPPPAYPQQPYPQQPYPPQSYPQQPYPPPYAQPPAPYPTTPVQPAPAPATPMLPPLLGTLAWQAEVRSVIVQDIAALLPANQARVAGIPLVFDPTNEVNAYAMCDANGNPGIVGTEGLLEAMDAIAQTKATDELYGTRSYEQYIAAVLPGLASSAKASAALPAGIIPANAANDPRRWSRAHEWFDEIAAFTFGHELSHHWLGHTGCANGPGNPIGALPGFLSRVGPTSFTQPAEFQADIEGTNTMLAAGRARAPQYRWKEEGGLVLLDFFLRLERTAPVLGQFVSAFLNSHPSSALRIPIVQATARTWYAQHPG